MTLQQLHYFIVTAKQRSFTRAAELCMVSQPALSHAIRELEQELNCSLFVRQGRRILLTEEGRQCFEKALEMEKLAREMQEIATRKETKREITIGYVVLGHLNAYLGFQTKAVPAKFLAQHQIFTAYDEITEIQQHLIERKYDFIIIPAVNCGGLPPHEKVQITEDALDLIVGGENAFFEWESVKVSELADAPFIFYPNNDDLNEAYRQLCRANGFEPEVAGYGKKMGDIISEVIQKNAVAFCSTTFDYLANRRIHIVNVQGELENFHLELVKLKANQREPAEELFRLFQKRDLRAKKA